MGDSDGNSTRQPQAGEPSETFGATGNFEGSSEENQQQHEYDSSTLSPTEQHDLNNQGAMDQDNNSPSSRGRVPRASGGGGPPKFRNPGYQSPGQQVRPTDFPLRILVLSDMVGAIIGKSGGTIRQITQETRARVDVHRKENSGSPEKVITIYGNPENCSKACKKIMEVMTEESNATTRQEVPLKILAHNSLIGRIIGKSGNTIKRIMEDTNTKIAVSSNLHDVNSFNLERVITIKGTVDDICRAEQQISGKLRQSYESDLAGMQSQAMAFPGLHPMAMMSPLSPPGPGGYSPRNVPQGPPPGPQYGGGPMYSQNPYVAPIMPYHGGAGPNISPGAPPAIGAHFSDQTKETVYLYIPNSSVGAIIGTGGSTIRDMINSSGASIKVAQPKDEVQSQQQQSPSPQPAGGPGPNERKVTIVGAPEAQWKAQFMLFRKVGFEGQQGPQDALLTVEIFVPSSQVGRIIGKSGQTVRELQRLTRATIKLPDESQNNTAEETPVHIKGDFLSTQAAQRQIRALVSRNTQASGGSGGPMPPRASGGGGRSSRGQSGGGDSSQKEQQQQQEESGSASPSGHESGGDEQQLQKSPSSSTTTTQAA